LQNQDDPKVVEQIEGETRIFATRRDNLTGAIAILKINVSNFHQEISALKAQMNSAAQQIELLNLELEALESLLAKGYTRRPQLLALKRTLAGLEASRRGNQAFIARAQQNIGGAELEIIKLRHDRHSGVVAELQGVQNEISKLEKRLAAATNVLRENLAAAARTETKLLDQTRGRIIITRNNADGPRDLEATEHTPVFPGDVIRIPGSLAFSSDLETYVNQSGRNDASGDLGSIESLAPERASTTPRID